MSLKPKILCIVGPTASGKTALALRLARERSGEIVNADSRQVYKGMDIATAKSVSADVPHYCFDLVSPDVVFSLSDWLLAARAAISDILSRGRLPILVGGTALYIRALTENLQMPDVPPDMALRARLAGMTAEEMFQELTKLDPKTAAVIDRKNPRRLMRALEVVINTGTSFSEQGTRGEPEYDAEILGVQISMDVLRERIAKRVDEQLAAGLVEEARDMIARYDMGIPSMSGIGYPEMREYLEGRMTLMEARELLITHTLQYAKRQMTFFKKMPVTWVQGV